MKMIAPYSVLYEDDELIAVNKASGISVTGDRWMPAKERLDKLLAQDQHLDILFTVHRIDQACSGVVVFAKKSDIHRELSIAFTQRTVRKEYIAVVHGRPVWQEYQCELPLLACATKKYGTIVEKHRGKKALTRFRYAGGAGNYSIIEASPQTGRQHQIRVHLASLGHPIVGDELYGSAKPVYLSSFKPGWRGDRFEERPLITRLALHACLLELPLSNRPDLSLTAPLARDIAALVQQIKKGEQKHNALQSR